MPRKGNIPVNKVKIDEILIKKMYLSGMSCKEIGDIYEVSFYLILRRLKSLGITIRSNSESHVGLFAKEKNPNWNGGKYVGSNGYVWMLHNGKRVLEHRYIIERHLKIKLLNTDVVHHINGDTTDNRIENLELLSGGQSEHMKKHINSEEARRRGAMAKRSRAALAAKEG